MLVEAEMFERLDWSKMAQTHVARPVDRGMAEKHPVSLPTKSMGVGDEVRYTLGSVEVHPQSARGYLAMGQPVMCETYAAPEDWPYPPKGSEAFEERFGY